MRPASSATLAATLLMLLGCTGDHLVEPPSLAGGPGSASARVELAAPSGLAATAVSATRIDLVWTDNSIGETGFELFRSTVGEAGPFALWATLSANTTAVTDSYAQPGTAYCFKIGAIRKTGAKTARSAVSNTACATTSVSPPPPTPPPPPSPPAVEGLSAAPYTSTDVWMIWGNQASDINYRIERSVDGGASWFAVGTTGGATSFYDQGLVSDQAVCYRIIAFNAGGDAPPSPQDCTAPPSAPSNLVATLGGDGAVELTWSDNSAVEDGYELWARITDYMYGYEFTDDYLMGGVPANATAFVCQGCAGGWPMFVRASKDGGISDNSNEVAMPLGR